MTAPTKARLHLAAPLTVGASLEATPEQAHYLAHVLRAQAGDALLLFNGRDGEWRAAIEGPRKNRATFRIEAQVRPPRAEPDAWLAFAPLKKDRTDFLVEKATELGAARLLPVFTRRTNAGRVNLERLRAQAVEAAEQCERLTVPEVAEPADLERLLADWPAGRLLLVPDETGGGPPLAQVLGEMRDCPAWGILVGPEGGFAPEEIENLGRAPQVRRVGLGPRILRAETAALAALALSQAFLGDFARQPRS